MVVEKILFFVIFGIVFFSLLADAVLFFEESDQEVVIERKQIKAVRLGEPVFAERVAVVKPLGRVVVREPLQRQATALRISPRPARRLA